MPTCPRCRNSLKIPPSIDPENRLRCPRCRRLFRVADLLVVAGKEGSVAVEQEQAAAGPSETDSPVTSDERTSSVVRRRYYSRTRLPKGAAPQKARRKRQPKTKFTRGDFIKVILGGLLALPVTQAILWWGFHRDPLDLGPSVASIAPFAVPYGFRGLPELEPPTSQYESNPQSRLTPGKPFQFERGQKGPRRMLPGTPPRAGEVPESKPHPADVPN
jgi:hypothetical protein